MKKTIASVAQLEILDHFKAIERVRAGLKEAIKSCPGPSKESGIKTIGPRCVSVSSSKIFNNVWSAESYVFPVQYEALVEVVETGDPQTIVERLTKALNDGKVRRRNQHTVNLHPEVVENVKRMLEGAV